MTLAAGSGIWPYVTNNSAFSRPNSRRPRWCFATAGIGTRPVMPKPTIPRAARRFATAPSAEHGCGAQLTRFGAHIDWQPVVGAVAFGILPARRLLCPI